MDTKSSTAGLSDFAPRAVCVGYRCLVGPKRARLVYDLRQMHKRTLVACDNTPGNKAGPPKKHRGQTAVDLTRVSSVQDRCIWGKVRLGMLGHSHHRCSTSASSTPQWMHAEVPALTRAALLGVQTPACRMEVSLFLNRGVLKGSV